MFKLERTFGWVAVYGIISTYGRSARIITRCVRGDDNAY